MAKNNPAKPSRSNNQRPSNQRPSKPSAAVRREKRATKLGFDSVEAMRSVTRQYGLTKNAQGKWVRPDIAFLEAQMAANGWGVGQTGVTPVMIGGMRWLTGQGQLTFTGQRSDAAKRNPGAAYVGAADTSGAAQGARALSAKEMERLARIQAAAGAQGILPGTAATPGGSFATGVSGATQQFVTEAGGGPAGEEAEEGKKTKNKKRAKQTKKLVKRVVKKTPVKGKVVRKALRSPGITAADKKIYARVAKTNPKLSRRLRMRDRRAAKK